MTESVPAVPGQVVASGNRLVRRGHWPGTGDSANSQAECAGSIPVIRSRAERLLWLSTAVAGLLRLSAPNAWPTKPTRRSRPWPRLSELFHGREKVNGSIP
jgi:hypothetical protein